MIKKRSLLRKLTIVLPGAALIASVPAAFAIGFTASAPKTAVASSAPSLTNASTVAKRAIATADQKDAETGFDAFLQASATGLNGSSYNAVVALYAAIGQTKTTAAAASDNANSARDLLNQLSNRDSDAAFTGGWSLNLSTSNFDGLSLSTLSFLQYFPNLTGISLVAQPAAVSPNPAGFKIDSMNDLAWISKVEGLRSLRIVNDPAKNPTQFSSASLSLFANLPLTSVDFTRFLSVAAGQTASRPIFATLTLNAPWYLTMPYQMTIRMPAGYTVATNASLYRVDNQAGVSTDVVKTIGPAVGNPNAANRNLVIDGVNYPAVLANSTLIWPFDDQSYARITYSDINGNYFTQSGTSRFPVTRRTMTSAETALYNTYATESARAVFAAQPIDATASNNRQNLEATVLVDGVSTPRVLVNGTLYWAFDGRTALFRNNAQTKFWTSYERISAEDLDPTKSDKVQSISRNVSSAQQDRSHSAVTTIEAPTSALDVFYFNNEPVQALLNVQTNKFFWDFSRQGILPRQIQYYSRSTKRAYSSAAALVDASAQSGFSYSSFSSADIASFDSVPTDPDHVPHDISGLADITDYITKRQNVVTSIDGVNYGYVLRNGMLYIDYDIENINFVAMVNNVPYYYTKASNIPPSQASAARLLPKISARTKPNPQAILQPNLAAEPKVQSILINQTETIGFGISNGELYWRFNSASVSGLAAIKYVAYVENITGAEYVPNYYTSDLFDLDPRLVVENHLTSVVPYTAPDDDPSSSGTAFGTSVLLSQSFDQKSYGTITQFDKIWIDGDRSYDRRIAHSRVYWLVQNTEQPTSDLSTISFQNFSGDRDTLLEQPFFYTSAALAQSKSKSFPDGIRQISPPIGASVSDDISKVVVKDPASASEVLNIYIDGVLVKVGTAPTSEPGRNFAWDDVVNVKKIKYAALQADGTYIYFNELRDDSWQRTDVAMNDVSEADTSAVTNSLIIRESKHLDNISEIEVVKYALIAVFSALFASGVGLFLWRVFRK